MTALVERANGTAAAGSGATRQRTVVVIDTCVLLSDPESVHSFPDADVVVPLTVIEELDSHKTRLDDVGRAARDTIRSIEDLRVANGGDIRSSVALPGGGTLRIETEVHGLARLEACGLSPVRADTKILAAALALRDSGREVRVVSSDAALRIKAAQLGLHAEDHRRGAGGGQHVGTHPGWRTAEVPASVVDRLYADGNVVLAELGGLGAGALQSLLPNEFAVCRSGQQSVLVRRHGDRLRRLGQQTEAWGLRPRSKEQRFALELLLDPDVPLVGLAGHAGTGKTVIALAAALEQVFEPAAARYDRLMILRPLVSVGRQDVGFLPGALDEKLAPWMRAVVDAIVALGDGVSHAWAGDQLDAWTREGKLTMEAVTFLRGRSLQRTFVIVDEAQNLEPTTLKTILTRVGEGSKCVLIGDVTQVDSPWLNSRLNALSVLIEAFAGEELFGHVVLTQGERSPLAELAAARL